MTPSKEYSERGKIIKKYALQNEIVNLNDVVEVKYHYTLAIGFDAELIFALNDGAKFVINYRDQKK